MTAKFTKLTYRVVRTESYFVTLILEDPDGHTIADGEQAVLQTISQKGKIPDENWAKVKEQKITVTLMDQEAAEAG